MKLTELMNKIDSNIVRRVLPFGLFSWRFLLPNQSETVVFHRNLIMRVYPNFPRPASLLLVFFTGIKWSFLYSPYYTYRTVKQLGKNHRKDIGLSLWQQFWRVLWVSMGHGLDPYDWYQFALYKPDRDLWNYVYDQEAAIIHPYRNRGRVHYKQHVALLSDKWLFEQYLNDRDIITTGTVAIIPKGTADFRKVLESYARQQQGQLFCKRRSGNQGSGAFSACWRKGHMQIKPLWEAALADTKIDSFLQKNTAKHDYLIQPEYRHNQRFQSAIADPSYPDIITIRIISNCTTGNQPEVSLQYAELNWSVMEDGEVSYIYPLAISLSHGMLDDTYPAFPRDNIDDKQRLVLDQFTESMSGVVLPFWEEAVRLVKAAHPLMSGVDMIAWDLILGEERAVLLEGNSGWGGFADCQWFGFDPLGNLSDTIQKH